MAGHSKQLDQILEKLRDLDTRLSLIEKKNGFKSSVESPSELANSKGTKGLQAGILLLVKHGFFAKQRTALEVKEELDREAYFYSIQAISMALTRDFTKKKLVLTRVKNELGTWVYALRK